MIKEIRKINMFDYKIENEYPLKNREYNALMNMGINTVGDLMYYCADDKDKLRDAKGIGPYSAHGIKQFIKTKIRDKRIYFGMPKEDIEKFKANGNGYVIEEELIKTSIFEYELSEIVSNSTWCGLIHLNVKTVYDLFVLCSTGVDNLLKIGQTGPSRKNSIISKIDDIISKTGEPVYLGMSKKDLDEYINSKTNNDRRISKIVGEDKEEEKSVVEPVKDEDLSFIEIAEEKFHNYAELCDCIKKLEEEVKNKEEEVKNKEKELKKLEDKIKEYEILKSKKKDLEALSSRLDNRILKLLYEFNHVQETPTELQKLK